MAEPLDKIMDEHRSMVNLLCVLIRQGPQADECNTLIDTPAEHLHIHTAASITCCPSRRATAGMSRSNPATTALLWRGAPDTSTGPR
jgi:hypothetical protein